MSTLWPDTIGEQKSSQYLHSSQSIPPFSFKIDNQDYPKNNNSKKHRNKTIKWIGFGYAPLAFFISFFITANIVNIAASNNFKLQDLLIINSFKEFVL